MPTQQSRYQFVTHWAIDAPIHAVWSELSHPEFWPQWWRGVVAVDLLEPGDAEGIGAYRRMTWRSRLPYRLAFNMRTTRIERHVTIEGVADGELAGTGKWTFACRGTASTDVRYDWEVEATKRWMRALAPIARPAFEWNHDVIMAWGLEGLKRRLRQHVA